MTKFNNQWDQILDGEFEKEYYQTLHKFLKNEYISQTIYPNMNDIFTALKLTSYEDVKVVILGQDPYHGMNQAHGLSFSVLKENKIPPSLRNIYKEINDDLGLPIPIHGELSKWAQDGVLLLNTCLTVREGKPNSHKGKGWEIFTDNIIKHLNNRAEPIVFMLWGANARSKQDLISNDIHLVLQSVHPSPLSASGGFFGCKHFSQANTFLIENDKSSIDWSIV